MLEKVQQPPKSARVCFIETDQISPEVKEKLASKLASRNFVNVEFNAGAIPRISNPDYYYIWGLATLSTVDSKNKFSNEYNNCLCLVGFGDTEDKHLSIMCHINTSIMAPDEQTVWEALSFELRKRLQELKLASTQGNLEVCILGGNKRDNYRTMPYTPAVERLTKLVHVAVAVNVQVLDRDYVSSEGKDIFVETDTRRIYQITTKRDVL